VLLASQLPPELSALLDPGLPAHPRQILAPHELPAPPEVPSVPGVSALAETAQLPVHCEKGNGKRGCDAPRSSHQQSSLGGRKGERSGKAA
jgi:hypothetical protein